MAIARWDPDRRSDDAEGAMTIPLSATNPTNVAVLGVLDALLALHRSADRELDRTDVDVDVLGLRLHLRVYGDVVAEAQIDLGDDDSSPLQALRWHLGPDTELATMHRRVHRWLVNGREVILDSFNGRRTCLRIA